MLLKKVAIKEIKNCIKKLESINHMRDFNLWKENTSKILKTYVDNDILIEQFNKGKKEVRIAVIHTNGYVYDSKENPNKKLLNYKEKKIQILNTCIDYINKNSIKLFRFK